MAYTLGTVANLLARLNRDIFVPAIQRDYVWNEEKILDLVDSLLKGYPFGTFLFWSPPERAVQHGNIYPFHLNFEKGTTVEPVFRDEGPIHLVLDGQQRLTSLNIAFQGTFAAAQGRKMGSARAVWIDLLQVPDIDRSELTDEDEDMHLNARSFDLRFGSQKPHTSSSLWMPLGRILSVETVEDLAELEVQLTKGQSHLTVAERLQIHETLSRLYRVTCKDEVLAWHTETAKSLDRVLSIFVRANDGGVKLKKAEMCMAMITSAWQRISARQEITELRRQIADRTGRKLTGQDMIVKSMLTLNDFGAVYDLGKLTLDRLKVLEKNWESVRETILLTYDLFNIFGLHGDSLKSGNVVIPIAYYVHLLRQKFPSSWRKHLSENGLLIQRFVMGSLVKQVFGGRADPVIDLLVPELRASLETGPGFPFQRITQIMAKQGFAVTLSASDRDRILAQGAGTLEFARLAMAYPPRFWGEHSWQKTKLVPDGTLTLAALMRAGLHQPHAEATMARLSGLANTCLLTKDEQSEHLSMPHHAWLDTRNGDFQKYHLLEGWPGLSDAAALARFLEERETALLERMMLRPRAENLAEPGFSMGGI